MGDICELLLPSLDRESSLPAFMLTKNPRSVCSVFLLPAFLTIEWTRAALWASRATVDGPLRVFAVLLNAIALTPVWIILSYSATMVWLPVRALLWVWGIGRDGPKKRSPAATARWYESKAARRRVETVSVEEQRARLGWRY